MRNEKISNGTKHGKVGGGMEGRSKLNDINSRSTQVMSQDSV